MQRLRAGSVCFLAMLTLKALALVNSEDISNPGNLFPESNLGSAPTNQRTVADILSSLKPNNAGPYLNGGTNEVIRERSDTDSQSQAPARDGSPSKEDTAEDHKSAYAHASGNSGVAGQPPSPFSPGLYSYPGTSSAQAQAEAISSGNLNPRQNLYFGLSQYGPGYASGFASSSAQAETHSGGYNQFNPYSSSPYSYPSSNSPGFKLPVSGTGSSIAQADASSGGLYPGRPYPSAYSQASANADASSNVINGFGSYSPSVPASSVLYPGGYSSGFQVQTIVTRPALSQAYGSGDQNLASTNAFTNVNSRPVPRHEYIQLNNIPGGNNLVCTRPGEFHYVWAELTCLVCACVIENGFMAPICVSCSGCNGDQPIPPPPSPLPPLPPPSINCSPLPTGQPFPNPLHPCQICICQEYINAFGQRDVQIECQNNPQCVLPPGVTILPPIPDPSPIPLPVCEKFPQNVMFPHPSDACVLCYCSVRLNEYEYPEEQITCQPNPACPEPAAITFSPPATPDPISPWTVPTPSPPGPLPGPPPHESCRPYVPNQPFQHPWDECQTCVCTESYSVGLITIEVNCFTKKSCCYEYIEPPGLGYTGGVIPGASASASVQSNANQLPSYLPSHRIPPNYLIGESLASSQSQNIPGYPGHYKEGNEYIIPRDQFAPSSFGGNQIGSNSYGPGSQAAASAQGYTGYPGYLGYPNQLKQEHSSAEADAIAYLPRYNSYASPGYSSLQNPGVYSHQGNVYDYSGLQSDEIANANAEAEAFANAMANSYGANSKPYINQDGPSYGQSPTAGMYTGLNPQSTYDVNPLYLASKGNMNNYKAPYLPGVSNPQAIKIKSGDDSDGKNSLSGDELQIESFLDDELKWRTDINTQDTTYYRDYTFHQVSKQTKQRTRRG